MNDYSNLKRWIAVGLLVTTCLASAADDSTESALSTDKPEKSVPWEKANIQVGGLIPVLSSDLVFGIQGANNQSINAEDTLGLDSTIAVFQIGAMYRPGESRRNQLDFSYAGFHRNGDAALNREVEIEGEVYPAGANVNTVFDFDIISATWSYALVQTERVRFALGVGVYVMPLEYNLTVQNTFIEGADTTLPLPVISVRGEFQLVRTLFLNTSVDGMYAEISDFRGAIVDFNLGLEYRPWKHIGLGLGYNYFYGGLEGMGSSDYPGVNFVGSVTVQYSGVLVYAKWCF